MLVVPTTAVYANGCVYDCIGYNIGYNIGLDYVGISTTVQPVRTWLRRAYGSLVCAVSTSVPIFRFRARSSVFYVEVRRKNLRRPAS